MNEALRAAVETLAGPIADPREINHRGVWTEDDVRAMRIRNETRLKRVQEQMGARWVGHPDNYINRKPTT